MHIEAAGAEEAIHALNGRNFQGLPLKVQYSKNQKNLDMYGGNSGPPAPGFRGGFRGSPMRGRGMGGFGGVGRGRGSFSRNSMLSAGGYQFGAHTQGPMGGGDGFDMDTQDPFEEVALPPVAKDRMELLELLDRRRRLEALDPYEVELIQCGDPFNLPPPPPEYLRLLRERAMVKARLPLPPSSLERSRGLTQSETSSPSSSVTRALIARRAAAVAASAREKLRNAALEADTFGDSKNGVDDFMYGGSLGGLDY